MKEIGQLIFCDERYEFRVPELGIIVRGDHPEWVIQAASEVLANTALLESEGQLDELETLVEFEEATEIEVASAKYAMQQRFGIVPQCIVTMGKMDYKWVAAQGREKLSAEFDGRPYSRIHDMSLTYDDTFLENEAGVDMADETDNQ